MDTKKEIGDGAVFKALRACAWQTSPTAYDDVINIVVPIFNGLDAVKVCLSSLIMHTDHRHRVRLINDGSTQPGLHDFLRSLACEYLHLDYQQFTDNCGYLQRVNEAMASLDGDVLLLNSDTVLTEDWLSPLIAAASDPRVAAVCPLSDNATILSLDIALFADGADSLARRLSQMQPNSWFPLPTAVGFCMLIKRETIDRLGVFDPFYSPGYGEECDYSMRIRQAGLFVACAPQSLVLHQGSQSFGAHGLALSQRHQRLLDIRWPDYLSEVKRFSEASPLRRVTEALQTRNNGAAKILHVLHSLESVGGTELFTKDFLQATQSRWQHTLIAPAFPPLKWQDAEEWHWDHDIRVLRFSPAGVDCKQVVLGFAADMDSMRLDTFFANLLAGGEFDLVHFHSMVGIGSLSWPEICSQMNVPYIQSIHDFFPACPDYNMFESLGDGEREPCGQVRSDSNNLRCQACFPRKIQRWIDGPRQPLDYLDNWHTGWRKILENAARIITPGCVVSDVLLGAFSSLDSADIDEVSPYLPDPGIRPIASLPDAHFLCVAFLGNFKFHKGSLTFANAIAQVDREQIRPRIIGEVVPEMVAVLEPLDIATTGRYHRSELDVHLRGVDLVVIPSLYEETYCITLSEAWSRGLPVLVSDVGALGSRVDEGQTGFLVPPADASALADRLSWLSGDAGRQALSQVRKQLASGLPDDSDPVVSIEGIYRTVLANQATPPVAKTGSPIEASPVYSDALQRWIDWPLCMEPTADWAECEQISVLVISCDARASDRQFTIDSLEQHALVAVTCQRSDTWALASARDKNWDNSGDYVLLIDAGNTVTENLGNWSQFATADGAAVVTADSFLHSDLGENYYPRFSGRFDPFRFYRRLPATGAIIVRKSWLAQQELENCDLAALMLHCLAQDGAAAISHFPYPALAIGDRYWVSGQRQCSQTRAILAAHIEHFGLRFACRVVADLVYDAGVESKTESPQVGVVIHCQQAFERLPGLIAELRQQTGVELPQVILVGPLLMREQAESLGLDLVHMRADEPASAINQAVARITANTVLLLAENVRLTKDYVLRRLYATLGWHGVVAVSPAFGYAEDDDNVFGPVLGVGVEGILGRGIIHDQRFDWRELPLMVDVLEDDALLFCKTAWQQVGGFKTETQHFLAVAGFSLALAELGLLRAMLPLAGINASELPAPPAMGDALKVLALEREHFVRSFPAQVRQGVNASQHFLPGTDLQLDTICGAFKTPPIRPRIIAYPHDQWASGFYRVRAPLTALVSADAIACHLLPDQRAQQVPKVHDLRRHQASALLLHNFLHDQQLHALRDYHTHLDLGLVLSLDDLLTEIPASNPFSATVYPDVDRRIRHALRLCHRLVVTTPALGAAFQDAIADIRVIPNYLPQDIWLGRRTKPDATESGRKLRVGWFGAPQHAGDLEILRTAVALSLDRYQWVFFGMHPPGIDNSAYEYHPMVPLAMFPERLQAMKLDIGVAPLVDNAFNRAKSNLKLLEFGVSGIPVVASKTGEYVNSPAILVSNDTQAWLAGIEKLATDTELRMHAAGEMYDWVRANYILEDHLEQWQSALLP